jgi:DNA-binding response OmpR family regulator
VKPFVFAELLVRIRVLLRRTGETDQLRRQIGDLTLDVENRRVYRSSKEITVTPREFDLLAYLVRHVTARRSRGGCSQRTRGASRTVSPRWTM